MDAHRSSSLRRSTRRPGRDYLRIWAMALAAFVIVALASAPFLGWALGLVAAWDAALLVLLGRQWQLILGADAQATRSHAAIEDPGKIVLFFVSVVAGVVGLAAAVFLLRDPKAFTPAERADLTTLLTALGIAAVIGAWVLVHTAFTFHYAHLYYREDGSPGGLDFPGREEPDDLDFAYFAFTIGMTFQTADVEISERGLRRAVLRHALLSFVFNTAILALAVSLLFDRL